MNYRDDSPFLFGSWENLFKCPSVHETLFVHKIRNLMTTNLQLMYQKSIVFFYLFTGISILFFFRCNYRYYNFLCTEGVTSLHFFSLNIYLLSL